MKLGETIALVNWTYDQMSILSWIGQLSFGQMTLGELTW